MSRVIFSLKVDDLGEYYELSERLAAFDTRTIQELMKSMGQELVEVSREHIERKTSPDGRPFAPWSAATKKQAAGTSRDILRDSLELFNSLSWRIIGDALLFGSDKEYAGVQQFGWPDRRIPARPFLGIGIQESQRIEDVLEYFGGFE